MCQKTVDEGLGVFGEESVQDELVGVVQGAVDGFEAVGVEVSVGEVECEKVKEDVIGEVEEINVGENEGEFGDVYQAGGGQ